MHIPVNVVHSGVPLGVGGLMIINYPPIWKGVSFYVEKYKGEGTEFHRRSARVKPPIRSGSCCVVK
jgi:hypothetical protein